LPSLPEQGGSTKVENRAGVPTLHNGMHLDIGGGDSIRELMAGLRNRRQGNSRGSEAQGQDQPQGPHHEEGPLPYNHGSRDRKLQRVMFSIPKQQTHGIQLLDDGSSSAFEPQGQPRIRSVSCHGRMEPDRHTESPCPPPPRASDCVFSRKQVTLHRPSPFGKIITSSPGKTIRPSSANQGKGGLWDLLENLQGPRT
jgi:hypothetical protein